MDSLFVVHSTSKFYSSPPTFIPVGRLADGRPPEGFSSLYAVDRATSEAVRIEGTSQGFAGIVASHDQTLWIDVDSYELCEKVEGRLKEMGYAYVAYDSGNRGGHFGIHRPCVPSHLLPAKDRAWVKQYFPEADTSIYSHLHLFRLPGTLHETSGRRKEFMHEVEGRPLEPLGLEKAQLPTIIRSSEDAGASVFESLRVLANSVPAGVGQRHATLVKLAYALRDDTSVDPEWALGYMLEVNKFFTESKDEKAVVEVWKSIFGQAR